MKTLAELYINGIKRKLKNYYAAWLPNAPLRLGDVGVLDGNLFTRVTTLEQLGIPFQERSDTDASPLDYVSESGVSIFFKAAGEINAALPSVPEAKAGVGIEFRGEGGFIVKAAETYEPSIENVSKLEADLIQALRNQRWQPTWAVIFRLVKAPSATILISNSVESRVELCATADMGIADLGKAGGDFEIKLQRGDILKFIGAQNISPFFQLARIKKKLWGTPYLGIKTLGTDGSRPQLRGLLDWNDPGTISSLYLDLVRDTEELDSLDLGR